MHRHVFLQKLEETKDKEMRSSLLRLLTRGTSLLNFYSLLCYFFIENFSLKVFGILS